MLGAAIFVAALSFRVANAPHAFAGAVPQIGLLDDIYHFKRMAHFVEFDRDRGERGEFCPWPPLYDFGAGMLARMLGARSDIEVLRAVVWIPPIVAALFIAVVSAFLSRRIGRAAAVAFGAAIAASPFLIAESSIGDIDHHFLEPILLFGILAATCAAMAKQRAAGILLGVAICAAMFVQTALVVACGLAFFALLFFSDGLAAAIGFSIAAIAVAMYRLTRAPGFPDSPWFLGWPHVALFAGAAVASAYFFWRRDRVFALLAGVATILAFPAAPRSIVSGAHFFGGEPWLRTIVEFQPIWRYPAWPWPATVLAIGAVFALLLVRRNTTIALFAIVYFLLTLSSLRFWSMSIPLLALAGAVYGARRPLLLIAVALPALVHYATWSGPEPAIGLRELPWIRAAQFLRMQPPGRVLAPWSMGHAIDVIGGRPVIVDNFGTMSNDVEFDRAQDAFLALDEESLARYCRGAKVRFVVVDNPLFGLQGTAANLGLDAEKFRATRLAAATWWWRAYYRRASRNFRLIYADPQPSWQGTPMFRGPAIMIWERINSGSG